MEDESTLVLVLDVSVTSWGKTVEPAKDRALGNAQLTLSDYIEHLHAFINAFLLINKQNAVGLVAMSDRKSHPLPLLSLGQRCLYAGATEKWRESETGVLQSQSQKYLRSHRRDRLGEREAILKELKEGISEILQAGLEHREEEEEEEEEEGKAQHLQHQQQAEHNSVALSSSYSKALCVLRSRQEQYEDFQGDAPLQRKTQRILFLPNGARDVPSQYVQVMNASFCAQKMQVVVDTFMLGSSDSSFLQQAASLTGGIYANFFSDMLHVPKFSLSTYLIHIFLPDPVTRKVLQLPKGHTSSSLKVSCFLTNKPVDVGYVCSVCLSIFSAKLTTCAVCGTLFANTRTLKKKVLNRS